MRVSKPSTGAFRSISAFVAFGMLAASLFGVLLLGEAASPHVALAQSQVYHMEQYNSDITVNKSDGSYDVVETLVYSFDSGNFHRGLREIDTSRADSISNVKVEEIQDGNPISYQQSSFDPDKSTSGVPGTFGTETSGSLLRIRWVFNYVSNTTKTFRVSYHVTGPIKVFSDHDVIDWYAVPPAWAVDVNSSKASVTLPPGTDASGYTVASSPTGETSKQGNVISWTASNIPSGTGFEVGVQVPLGVINATKPSWQDREDRMPLMNFIVLVISLVLTALGILWTVRKWYTQGRDKPVKLVAEYLTDPPSDLPPGLVGTLLDESADVRDVIATVVDLARKGDLTMQEVGGSGLFAGKDFQYAQTGSKTDYRYEDMVLSALFKKGSPVKLSDLKNSFYSDLGGIYSEMYNSLVGLKYFPERPDSVRNANAGIGIGLIVLGVLFSIFVGGFLSSIASLSWLLGAAIVVAGIVRIATAHIMPRKTDFGAEEAEKWRAFSRYLQQIQRYTNVQTAADKFQQYLPYAVAMGVERELIGQFNSVPAAMPAWYAPYGYTPWIYSYPVGSGQTIAGGGGGGMPTFDPGAAMQGMSNSLSGAMQGMADSFTSMVNSASSILTSSPSSGGSGGWGGGGGGGFGGGGGGGGGGGAD